jgi:hypothetical protein
VGQNEGTTSLFHRVASAYVSRLVPPTQAMIHILSVTLFVLSHFPMIQEGLCMITTNSERIMTRLEVGERVFLYLLTFVSAMATSYD